MSSLSQKQTTHIAETKYATNYNCVDLIKFLCSLMIFFIHISPLPFDASGTAKYFDDGLRQYLCRIAVPFFFVSSGFFLFRKMPLYEPNRETIQTYCFKVLRLLGMWSVLLIRGTSYHLWHLGATVIAVLFLSLCLRYRIKYKYLYVLACLLYVIGLIGDSYNGVLLPLKNISLLEYIEKGYFFIFETTRNGIFMGFMFVLMGASFAHRSINIKPWTSFVGFAVSMLCLFVEVFLLKYHDIPIDYNMYIFLVPAVFFLFSLSLNVRLKDRPIYKHLRNIGLLICLSHLMFYDFVAVALEVLSKWCNFNAAKYQFVLTLFITLLFAACVEWLSCKKKFKWLKWLVS